jgi:hypothetical protein
VVHPEQWRPLSQALPSAQIKLFPRAGHFFMLDEPGLFVSTLHNFLSTTNGRDANHMLALDMPPKIKARTLQPEMK